MFGIGDESASMSGPHVVAYSSRSCGKVRIDAFEYEVFLIKSPCEELVIDNNVAIGSVHYDTKRIYISDSLGDQARQCTLIHEVIHALVTERDIRDEKAISEEFTEAFSRGLMMLMADNPNIMHWFDCCDPSN